MGIFDRLFGRKPPAQAPANQPTTEAPVAPTESAERQKTPPPEPAATSPADGAAAAFSPRQVQPTVTNADALTSAPASMLSQIFGSPDAWAMLLEMPPAVLYCGFAKYAAPDGNGVWMRTHGCEKLGLP